MPGPWYFAWAGGTIQDQTTVVTNGNTHGAQIQQVSVVGDLLNGQLVNLASVQSLEVGSLYGITGPGLTPAAFFMYDTSVLVGMEPGSVNLVGSSGSITSATFTATKWTPAGVVIGTSLTDSSVVVFSTDLDLVPGQYYGIAGASESLGYTPTPVPIYTGIGGGTTTTGPGNTIVSSAYFLYTGSLSAHMKVMVATPTIHTFVGGQTITYTVHEADVFALATGEFPFEITGPPDRDWSSITSIPVGVLSALTPNLRYNISGNGIPAGATFLAPEAGATSIELDLPATASDIGAILTITGPRTPSAPFDPTIHNRFDEDVLGFTIEQHEGDFATLNIDLRNPAVGLLAVGRNLWCWLSYDSNWGTTDAPDLNPIFTGRLVGVPRLQAGEVVQLQFLARPDDYNAQKVALSNSLQVLPFFDPIWLTANPTPDVVLEAYSSLWHTDRVSLAVSTSDILQGEDGTLTIGEDQAFYDNFSLSYGQPPLTAVTVSGTVAWQQEADGLVDVTGKIWKAFKADGSPWGGLDIPWTSNQSGGVYARYFASSNMLPGSALIATLNGDGLFNDWPKPGTNIGGGWSLTTLNDANGHPYCYIRDANTPIGWLPPFYYSMSTVATPTPPADATQQQKDFTLIGLSGTVESVYVWTLNNYQIRMVLRYKADRKRTETVTAVVVGDVQRELSDTSDSDHDAINLTSEYVGQGVDPGGGIPIGDLSRRSYFQTDRGAGSFEHLLLLARAKMRARARSADITFAVDFSTALGIGLRNSVAYFDRRLPGGSALGKVKSYKLMVEGGRQFGEFTIGCSIGTGNASSAQIGINSYVDDDYVEPGYQVIAGAQYPLLADELAYQTLDQFAVVDDGIDFHNLNSDTAVNECIVTNGLTTKVNALQSNFGTLPIVSQPIFGNPNQLMKTLKTTVMLDLKPVAGGEFHTDFFPAVSLLALPKTIDLTATVDVLESLWDRGIGGAVWDAGSTEWDCPP